MDQPDLFDVGLDPLMDTSDQILWRNFGWRKFAPHQDFDAEATCRLSIADLFADTHADDVALRSWTYGSLEQLGASLPRWPDKALR
ncbi:MAG: hypothetical protein E7812_00330 [Phenylobacterium sp.]|nr:MAG: hypothetical protein E7812_00330 [Phenylobacterium sp.]